MKARRNNQKAFSLPELLVVLVIIGIQGNCASVIENR